MEYILLNCVLALLDYPGATLLGINRLLVDKEYRSRVIAKIRNPIVKTFWVAEFTSWSEKYATEAIAPVQNKVGQFLSASIIRNIVAQVKSTINPRQIMDEGKIFIVNLAKGKIGEDNMRLLGGMIVTKLQLAAMERVDIKNEADRRDFYLFVDEFQNFANESFASILSEARKYRLNLTVAHQYIEQLDEAVRDAVFGNVGTALVFRVGAPDAAFLETEFAPTFTPEDLTNLAKFQIYLKLMVDGVATAPFSADTLAPIAQRTDSTEKVIAVSRERYASPRAVIEEKVLRWSGMETAAPGQAEGTTLLNLGTSNATQYPAIMTEDEQTARDALGGVPASLRMSTRPAEDSSLALDAETPAAEDKGEYLRISPERLAAIVKPPSGNQPKKEKPKFKHTCTRCGKVWEMPIQLDASRPMYCAECMPLVREERKGTQTMMKAAVRSDSAAAAAPIAKRGADLESIMQAAEEGRTVALRTQPSAKREPPVQNRPRLVVTDTAKLERLNDDEEEEEERSALLDDVAKTRGRPIETRKQSVVPPHIVEPEQVRAAPPAPPRRPETPRSDRRPPNPSPRPPNGPGRGPRPSAPNQGSHSPRIVPAAPPRQDRNRPTDARPQGKPRRSVEDIFSEAEERTDRAITTGHSERSHVGSAQHVAAPTDELEDRSATVFRVPASSVHSTPTPSSESPGPRALAPGQRIRFDE